MKGQIISGIIEDNFTKDMIRRFNPIRIHQVLRSGYNEVADQLEIDASRMLPRDTNRLAQSFKKNFVSDGIEVGYDTPYAHYQERGERMDGTRKIQNRPAGGETGFLRKAVERNQENYVDILKDRLLKDI